MRPLAAAALSICVFVFACAKNADALDCPAAYWWNFDRLDGDRQKRRLDAEARAAWANLAPIVFRGRFASARDLSDLRTNNTPVSLVVFEDVEVLRGEMPRSARDRKAFIVQHGWCDTGCGPASQGRSRELTTFGAYAFKGGPVRDATISKKVVYEGRVDAEMGPCSQILTPLQEQLLSAPPDEIARLIREYPFHPIRKDQPADSD